MHKPFTDPDEPESASYLRVKNKFLRESVWRFMSVGGILSVTMAVYLSTQFDLTNKWSTFQFLVWGLGFFLFQAFSAWVNAKRQIKVFLSNRWELTDELISPYVRRELQSPLDPITTLDICADALSSITLSQILGSSKGLQFSYSPSNSLLKLSQTKPSFLGLSIHVEILFQKDRVTKVIIQSRPGLTRFYIQHGDAYQWVTKIAHHLEDVLQQKRWARDAKLRELDLEKAALESKLAALQAQVEPHFLFNTLANLKYLIRTDTSAAQELLEHIVGYLHAALPDMRSISSTVEKEFRLAEHYLRIIQIRMGDRLRFTLTYDPNVANMKVPPAMLISLVENAIKHGLEKATRAGNIHISAKKIVETKGTKLIVSVIDDGLGLIDHSGQGIGLANIHQRLSLLYGDSASLVVKPNADNGVDASIYIPV